MHPSSVEVEAGKELTIKGKEYAYVDVTKELLEKDLGKGITVTVETIPAADPNPEKKVITLYVVDKTVSTRHCSMVLFFTNML